MAFSNSIDPSSLDNPHSKDSDEEDSEEDGEKNESNILKAQKKKR